MPALGSLSVEVSSFTDMKLEVLGVLSKKTMARSWPPVREAKWWMRSSVFGSAASNIQEGAKSSTRNSRVDLALLMLVSTEADIGMTRS